jgi:hypothetical protein
MSIKKNKSVNIVSIDFCYNNILFVIMYMHNVYNILCLCIMYNCIIHTYIGNKNKNSFLKIILQENNTSRSKTNII